jgi:hypothetical protein
MRGFRVYSTRPLTKINKPSEYQAHIFDALQYALGDIAGRTD